MGSTSFTEVYYGKASAPDAYSELVSQALVEYGHDGYNGTISTTRGVSLVKVQPMTVEAASALAEMRIEKLSKWDVCEAIPLVAETRAEYELWPDQEVHLTVTGAVYNDQAQLALAARKALGMNANLEVTEVKIKVDRDAGYKRLGTVEKRVVAEVPKEPAETRYFITAGPRTTYDWDEGYPTQAAARADLGKVLRYDYNGIPDVEAEIVGLTRRKSGAPLVKATVSAKKVTGTFVVKTRRLTKRATAGTERAGFFFYGWAAC